MRGPGGVGGTVLPMVLCILASACEARNPATESAARRRSSGDFVVVVAGRTGNGLRLRVSPARKVSRLGLRTGEELPQPLTGARFMPPPITLPTGGPRVREAGRASPPAARTWCLWTVGAEPTTDLRCLRPARRYHLAPGRDGDPGVAAAIERPAAAVRLRVLPADREVVFAAGVRSVRAEIER